MRRYKLSEIFNLQMGKTPSRNNHQYWTNATEYWVSIADLSSFGKYTKQTKEKISLIAVQESGIRQIPENTVIMSFKLSLGKTAITSEKLYTNEAIMAFQDKGIVEIDANYIYYLFSGKDWSKGTNRAVLGATLNKATLSDIEIPLPPLAEQQKIADTLDKVSHLIALRKEQLNKLDLLVKAKFVEMFGDPVENPKGWETIKILNALVVQPQNGLYKPSSEYVDANNGTPILRIDAFYNGKVTTYEKLKRLKCTEADIQKYGLNENDIVINRVNSLEYLGKCAHIYNLPENVVFESNMMRMHFKDDMYNAAYISHLLCTDFMYQQIISHAKKAVNQASINQKDVQDFDIYTPPLPLQTQFANYVTQVETSKQQIQQALNKLETLYKSLMQKYFE